MLWCCCLIFLLVPCRIEVSIKDPSLCVSNMGEDDRNVMMDTNAVKDLDIQMNRPNVDSLKMDTNSNPYSVSI